ncbi:hypothetical protein EDD21DRAFT_418760 [Dissophora ornata]|nr:hypothetical protein EDD21DRAFT_418760 [Dissophora ornata]
MQNSQCRELEQGKGKMTFTVARQGKVEGKDKDREDEGCKKEWAKQVVVRDSGPVDTNPIIIERSIVASPPHTLSGAVLEPQALNDLISDWKGKETPLSQPEQSDLEKQFIKSMELSAKNYANSIPRPQRMSGKSNHFVSLSNDVKRLSEQAEKAGFETIPGFASSEAFN